MLARVGTAAFVVALGWGTGRLGLPSSYLFAALVAGVAIASSPSRCCGS